MEKKGSPQIINYTQNILINMYFLFFHVKLYSKNETQFGK